jgi:hypothetical protein
LGIFTIKNIFLKTIDIFLGNLPNSDIKPKVIILFLILQLNLWNLNANTENPVTSIVVGETATKLRWARNGEGIIHFPLIHIISFLKVNNWWWATSLAVYIF